MSKRKKQSFVTVDDCAHFRAEIRGELKVLKTALVGEDLRGGLVKDVADIKSKLSMWSAAKDIVIAIAVAVASALITAWILSV